MRSLVERHLFREQDDVSSNLTALTILMSRFSLKKSAENFNGDGRGLVALSFWERAVKGSNPLSPTILNEHSWQSGFMHLTTNQDYAGSIPAGCPKNKLRFFLDAQVEQR